MERQHSLEGETLIPLSQAAEHIPPELIPYGPPTYRTMRRAMERGELETIKRRGKRLTSVEAVKRFAEVVFNDHDRPTGGTGWRQ